MWVPYPTLFRDRKMLYGKITLKWIQHNSTGNLNKILILKLDQTLLSLPGRINPTSISTYHMWILNSIQLHMYDIVYVELLSMLNSFVEYWIHVHMRISREILATSNESNISLVSWKYITHLQMLKKCGMVELGVMEQRVQGRLSYIWEFKV